MRVSTRHYEGQEFLAKKGITDVPELGLHIADFLGELMRGLYKLDPLSFEPFHRGEWYNHQGTAVYIRLGQGLSLCTFDGDFLTRLVLLSHDWGVRVELIPNTVHNKPQLLKLVVTPYEPPMIEGVLARHRSQYPQSEA